MGGGGEGREGGNNLIMSRGFGEIELRMGLKGIYGTLGEEGIWGDIQEEWRRGCGFIGFVCAF